MLFKLCVQYDVLSHTFHIAALVHHDESESESIDSISFVSESDFNPDSSRGSTPDVGGAATRSTMSDCWNWADSFRIDWQKMPAGLKQAIKSRQRPLAKYRRKMIHIISDDILAKGGQISRKGLVTVARMVVSTHPESFRDVDPQSSNVIGSGYDSICSQIENRIYNLKRHSSLHGSSSRSSDATEIVPTQTKRARKDNYGCMNWEPSLPEAEILQGLKDKELLKREYSAGVAKLGFPHSRLYAFSSNSDNIVYHPP